MSIDARAPSEAGAGGGTSGGDATSDMIGCSVPPFQRYARAYLARGLFPIPGRGGIATAPKFCHKYDIKKTDLWTRPRANLYGLWLECEALGLLLDAPPQNGETPKAGELRGLLVLDFDTKSLYADFANKFEQLHTCPLVSTAKGFHAYFLRSPLCNALQLTDGARQFEDENGTKLELDIKSYTKSGIDGHPTSGYIVVPPSSGKVWIRDICTTDVVEISDALVTYLYGRKVTQAITKKRKKDAGKTESCDEDDSKPSKPELTIEDNSVARPPRPPTPVRWWHVGPERAFEHSIACLRKLGFTHPELPSAISNPNARCSEVGYAFGVEFFDPRGVASKPCPLCGKADNHQNNAFWLMFREKEDGVFGRYVLNYSKNCKPNGEHRGMEVPFSSEGAIAWSRYFFATCQELDPAPFKPLFSSPASWLRPSFSAASSSLSSPAFSVWLRENVLYLFVDRTFVVVRLRLSDGRLLVSSVQCPWASATTGGVRSSVRNPLALLCALDAAVRK